MTLPSAPSAISFNDISLELFCTVQSYNLNDSYGRCITCLPTPNTTISLSNFYGKTAPLSIIGTCAYGGWYMGCTTSAGGGNYYLIAAPWSGGGAICEFFRSYGPASAGPSNTCVCQCLPFIAQPCSVYDGYYMTKFIQACPGYNPPAPISSPTCTWTYPMGSVAANLNLNGYSDWYVPAQSEICTLFCNSDMAWKCGSLMKSTGNQWPTATICACPGPAFAGAPGCLPYLGYTAGVLSPGSNSILALGCNSGIGCTWTCGNPACAITPSFGLLLGQPVPGQTPMYLQMATMTVPCVCPPPRCPVSTGTYFTMSIGVMCNRLQCSPGSNCSAIYPQPQCWGSGSEQRYVLRATRAVRRQAF